MTEINFSPFFSGWNSSLKYESKNSRKTSNPRPRSLSHRMWTWSHYNFEPNGPVRIQSYYSHCRPKYKLHQLDYGKSDIPLVIDDIAPCYLYIFAIEEYYSSRLNLLTCPSNTFCYKINHPFSYPVSTWTFYQCYNWRAIS